MIKLYTYAGMTIVGTTDRPSDITFVPAPTENDVKFIVDEANRYLNRRVSVDFYMQYTDNDVACEMLLHKLIHFYSFRVFGCACS